MTKKQITKKLEEIGACWAMKDSKYIDIDSPGDSWEKKPTWNIHPDCACPHINHIKRFDTLQDLADWLDEVKANMFTEFAEIERY